MEQDSLLILCCEREVKDEEQALSLPLPNTSSVPAVPAYQFSSQHIRNLGDSKDAPMCRGPAPADPGYSKERRHRRPIYLNILSKI